MARWRGVTPLRDGRWTAWGYIGVASCHSRSKVFTKYAMIAGWRISRATLEPVGRVRSGNEGDGPVDDEDSVGDLVEVAGLRVPPKLLVAGEDEGLVARRSLVEGTNTGALVEQGLVAVHGDDMRPPAVLVAVLDGRLDGEKFPGGGGHGLGDGLVGPLVAEKDADRWRVRGRGRGGRVHEGFEHLSQSFLAAPLVSDALRHAAQEPG